MGSAETQKNIHIDSSPEADGSFVKMDERIKSIRSIQRMIASMNENLGINSRVAVLEGIPEKKLLEDAPRFVTQRGREVYETVAFWPE